MINSYDLVTRLTSTILSGQERIKMLSDFAYNFGWHPSDSLEDPFVCDFSNAHLIVEHGLENTAVITFLKSPRRYSDLNYEENKRLLTISYNNLVDWHIYIQPDEVNFIYNRIDPPKPVEKLTNFAKSWSSTIHAPRNHWLRPAEYPTRSEYWIQFKAGYHDASPVSWSIFRVSILGNLQSSCRRL